MNNLKKFIKRALRFIKDISYLILCKVSVFIIWVSKFTRIEFELRNYINRHYYDFYLRKNFLKYIKKILNKKIIHLDVGSRGGVLEVVSKYSDFIEVIMCEPEKKEAERLRKEKNKVIDMPLSKEPGKVSFFEVQLLDGSSIYKPQGPFLDFYNSDPAYLSLYDVVRETTLDCSSIDVELTNMGISELDFLKIDTQGSELDIIKGLGDYRPLVMQVEIQYLPLYHDVPNAYQVCQYLFELGYIPFIITSPHARTLCPTWGDGFFMPSWVDLKGIKLIKEREEKYISLMLMFGQGKILKFVNQKIKLKNQKFINSLRI